MSDSNVWTDGWDPGEDWLPFRFHHGFEEMMVVLRGRPTLRTGAGERQLSPGEVPHFPTGPTGSRSVERHR